MTQGSDPGEVTREEVRAALDEIFADPRFDQSPTWFDEFLDWLGDLFNLGDGVSGAVGLLTIVLRIAAVLAALLVVFLAVNYIRQAWLPNKRARAEADLAGLVRDRVAELRKAAREAELSGEHLLALRLYFFALVVGLGERGELAYNDAWTNRELLERGSPTSEVARTLGPLLGELDRMSFGQRAVETADVRRFDDLCDRLLGGGAE